MPDSLGDRIKRYEQVTINYLTCRVPVIIRLDGRAFHTYTKKFTKPFSPLLMDAMTYAAKETANEMQGFKLAYIQSDEVTFLLTDFEDIATEAWFDYNINKIISISAALMSSYFNRFVLDNKTAVFDARSFNVPFDDVANVFLWRVKDWERNSLQMYCQSFFSHKDLHKKNKEEMHEMLNKINRNWTKDLSNREKNGTFLTIKDGKIVQCLTEIDGRVTYDMIQKEINKVIQ
jgi:tRNA(His) guanylyltransferase